MRVWIYAAILILLLFVPLHRLDIAQLEPVQTLAIQSTDDMIRLETDTGQKGQGSTVPLAIADLESKTPGVIYLDTAQYLLITENALQIAHDLQQHLKPWVRVCIWDGESSVSGAAQYLKKRTDMPRFYRWKQTVEKIKKSEK